MKSLVLILLVATVLETVVGPPVTENKKKKEDDKEKRDEKLEEMGIEYNRYLVQVVEALESDPDFRKKLENATSEDIQSGKIAEELDFVSHNVRTKLDELKRVELERLRKLARQAYEHENEIDGAHINAPDEPQHLDHTNPHTFEIADLKKLIAKTAEDLAEADKMRREEFKTYEMEKEFEKQQKLNELDEEHKKKLLAEMEEKKKKHKQHDPLHHPGSKQQLEEVWEKQDHMEAQEFDPKSFFFMHDLDGNGVWDEAEVKALFIKELDKMYQAGAPEDDMRERAEEMERMREHVFREADLNHDNLISFDEFLQQTKKPEFEKDPGWEPLDEQQIYTQDEYREFEHRRQQEIQRLIAEGKLQPPPVYHPPPPGYHQPPSYHQMPVQPPQVPYDQQQQHFQQQQAYQQQQHYQQQQQNNYKQQQQYQQQNPQHYQQYQQPPPNQQQFQQNQQFPQQNQQFQQQPQQNQQFQQQAQQNQQGNQQRPLSNSIPQQQQPSQPVPPQNQPNLPVFSNEIPKSNNSPPPPVLPVQSNNIHPSPVQSNNIPPSPVQSNYVPPSPVQSNYVPPSPVQSNNVPPVPVPSNNLPPVPVPSNNLPPVPIQSINVPPAPVK